MTFCLGMKLEDGIVGIADTRITSGTEVTTARKLTVYRQERGVMFVMTSGLRAARDKVLTYFDEVTEAREDSFGRLYQAVNAFGAQIRRVADEDREALEASNLHFNITCIVGGQLAHDKEHKLYMLYPEGNWIEISVGTPFHIIGEAGYGKPILRRTLEYENSLRDALRVGLLAFDSTRISAADVDFPIDVVVYRKGSFELTETRLQAEDMRELTDWWQAHLRQGVQQIPAAMISHIVGAGEAEEEGDGEALSFPGAG